MDTGKHIEDYNKVSQITHNSNLDKQELSYELNKILTKHNMTLDTVLYYANYYQDTHIASHLVEEGANVHLKNRRGRAPMHFAAENNDVSTINLLAGKGAYPDEKDYFGYTPLHRAVFYSSLEAIKLLVTTLKVNVNEINNKGYTPLHLAVFNNNLNTAKLLISLKANVDVKDCYNNTPLSYAKIKKNREMIELFEATNIEAPVSSPSIISSINKSNNYKLQSENKALCNVVIFILPLVIGIICLYLLGGRIATIYAIITAVILSTLCALRMLHYNRKKLSECTGKDVVKETINVTTEIDNQEQLDNTLKTNESEDTKNRIATLSDSNAISPLGSESILDSFSVSTAM